MGGQCSGLTPIKRYGSCGKFGGGTPPVHTPEERCQKAFCVKVLMESRVEKRAAEEKYLRLKQNFDAEVKLASEGLVRAAHASYAEEIERREQAEREKSKASGKANTYRTLAQRQAEDIAELADLVAELKGKVAAATQREAVAARAESRDVRAAARVSSQAVEAARLAGAQAAGAAAAAQIAAAEDRCKERVGAAEAHAADMEAQVDEAEEVAEVAMQEALAERASAVAASQAICPPHAHHRSLLLLLLLLHVRCDML